MGGRTTIHPINSKNLHILIVEDHADSRTALTWFLSGGGHRVRAATDAVHALQLLDETAVDVMMIDLLMPEVSGLELMERLRLGSLLPPYVISMSVMHLWDALPQSQAAGCHAHLVKPFTTGELTQVLEQACASIH